MTCPECGLPVNADTGVCLSCWHEFSRMDRLFPSLAEIAMAQEARESAKRCEEVDE